jgi:hypothetical protein
MESYQLLLQQARRGAHDMGTSARFKFGDESGLFHCQDLDDELELPNLKQEGVSVIVLFHAE